MNKKNTLAPSSALPAQPESAIQHLCRLSQSLLDLAERESQALIQNDMLSFAILQDEKESLSLRYLDASRAFRDRINDFRRVEKTMIGRLETIQNRLGERTNDNNVLIGHIRDRAEVKAQEGLLMAQEYSRSKAVHYEQNSAEEGDLS